jgi:hypothetical protein
MTASNALLVRGHLESLLRIIEQLPDEVFSAGDIHEMEGEVLLRYADRIVVSDQLWEQARGANRYRPGGERECISLRKDLEKSIDRCR